MASAGSVPTSECSSAALLIVEENDIGTGGYAFVRRCQYKDKLRAIKFAKRNKEDTLEKEFKILIGLSHENVLKVIALVDHELGRGLVMELAGFCLYTRTFKVKDKYSVSEAVGWMRDAGNGLSYVHSQNIIHRDFKPLNLLVFINGSSSRVKLADFGFAVKLEYRDQKVPSEEFKGTFEFAVPEVFKEEYTFKGDVYSFGVTLFKVFERQRAYETDNYGHDFAWQLLIEKLKIKTCELAPDAIKDIIKKCCLFDSEKRPNIEEVTEQLKNAFQEMPIDVKNQEIENRFPQFCESESN